jgi:hypothetical protein
LQVWHTISCLSHCAECPNLQVLLPAAGGGFSAPAAVPISEVEPPNPDPAAAQLRAECDLAPAAPKPPDILSMCFAGAGSFAGGSVLHCLLALRVPEGMGMAWALDRCRVLCLHPGSSANLSVRFAT